MLQYHFMTYFLKDTDAIIFVIDSNDLFYECKHDLTKLLEVEELRSAPLLVVMANKQGLPGSGAMLSKEEIAGNLTLENLQNREWRKCTIGKI